MKCRIVLLMMAMLYSIFLNGQGVLEYNQKGKNKRTVSFLFYNSYEDNIIITNVDKIQSNYIYTCSEKDTAWDFVCNIAGKMQTEFLYDDMPYRCRGKALYKGEKVVFKFKYRILKKLEKEDVFFIFREFNTCSNSGYVHIVPLNGKGMYNVVKISSFTEKVW